MKKKLSILFSWLVVMLIGLSASAGNIIAECTITKSRQPNGIIVFIEAWDEPSNIDFPSHATHLYSEGESSYSFWAPFSNNLSRVNISIGHPSGGGIASDYHFLGDLNKSNLEVVDMKSGVEIKCTKK